MLATLEDVIDAIAGGALLEHRHLNIELKEDWAQDYGKKLCALANKTEVPAAFLIVGLNDRSGLPVGKEEKWIKAKEEVISQHLNANLDPVQTCTAIQCHETGTGWVAIIAVANPGALVKWNHKAYKASGTTESLMTPMEEMELTVLLPGLEDYSRRPWSGPADPALVSKFAEMIVQHRPNDGYVANLTKLSPSDVLEKLSLANTNVARVLFGNAKFRIVWFNHNGVPIQNDQHSGLFCILTPTFRQQVNDWVGKMLSAQQAPFSLLALKEALANAVAHAAYFENDGEIIIEVWPNRVSVTNLCVPAAAYFANKWFSRAHKTFNVLLVEALRLCGVVDELGRGKSLIFRESIMGGHRTPHVDIEQAGRFGRWRLTIHTGAADERIVRLLERLREIYQDEQKALVAGALVLWANEPVATIKQYMDGETRQILAEVLSNPKCPVLFSASEDRILVKRWPLVLLGEGKDSKKLSASEEKHIYEMAYRLSKKYHNYVITTQQFKDWAGMGDAPSERVLTSTILSQWAKAGKSERVARGVYKFRPNRSLDSIDAIEMFNQAINAITKKTA